MGASIASGLLRIAMFGTDGARTESSAAFLTLNALVSSVVSFVAVATIAGGRRARPGSLVRTATVAVVLGAMWVPMSGASAQESPAPVPTFDFNKKFSRGYFLIHIIETGTLGGPVKKDAWILWPEEPDSNGILITPDGQGGTFSNKTDSSEGPFRTPAQVCVSADGKVDSFSVEDVAWNCADFRELKRKVIGTTAFGVMGTILLGLAWTTGSVVTGGLGIVAGGVAVWIWNRGAPRPVRRIPIVSRYMDFAKGEAVKLESAQLRGLTPEEAGELGVFLETLTPQQKMAVGKELGMEYQKLSEALKDYKNLPPNFF